MNISIQPPVLQEAQRDFIPTGHAIRVFGMRRSGNHGIINWIKRNTDSGQTIFLNNCRFGDPLLMFQSVAHSKGTAERRILNVENHPKMRRAVVQFNTSENHIVSYENLTLGEIQADPTTPDGRYAPTVEWKNVLIYRRFLNWLASYLKLMHKKKSAPYRHTFRDALWRYKAALLEVDRLQGDDIIPIHYDRWAADPAYRENRLSKLSLPILDNSLGEIARYGGGSSFGQEPQTSDTVVHAERWAEFENQSKFRKILNAMLDDPEFHGLVEKHFPEDIAIAQNLVTRSKG